MQRVTEWPLRTFVFIIGIASWALMLIFLAYFLGTVLNGMAALNTGNYMVPVGTEEWRVNIGMDMVMRIAYRGVAQLCNLKGMIKTFQTVKNPWGTDLFAKQPTRKPSYFEYFRRAPNRQNTRRPRDLKMRPSYLLTPSGEHNGQVAANSTLLINKADDFLDSHKDVDDEHKIWPIHDSLREKRQGAGGKPGGAGGKPGGAGGKPGGAGGKPGGAGGKPGGAGGQGGGGDGGSVGLLQVVKGYKGRKTLEMSCMEFKRLLEFSMAKSQVHFRQQMTSTNSEREQNILIAIAAMLAVLSGLGCIASYYLIVGARRGSRVYMLPWIVVCGVAVYAWTLFFVGTQTGKHGFSSEYVAAGLIVGCGLIVLHAIAAIFVVMFYGKLFLRERRAKRGETGQPPPL